MARDVITAVFGATKATQTAARYQYDYGQRIQFAGVQGLPRAYEVHFANEGDAEAKRMLTDDGTALVPDELFTTGRNILAWVYVHTGEADGETVYLAKIPVMPRARPVDYTPTPVEAGLVEQALALLNQEIADIENAHQNALVAQAAQQAAERAQSAAEDAATSASSSAETAARDAAEAAQSTIDAALTAIENAATRAAASESNASRDAASAAQSATDSQTAQTAAEAARDRAETAATAAETHSIGMALSGTTLVLTSPREG